MKKELVFVSAAMPGGFDYSCGLRYYTNVLAYRVTFDTHYKIERFDRINNIDWTPVLTAADLGETIQGLLPYGPFLMTAAEANYYWTGVRL